MLKYIVTLVQRITLIRVYKGSGAGAGSGSTIVCVGSDEAPQFLKEPQYKDLFIAPARLIARQPGEWYQPTAPALANVAA